ncbi:MAG: hypothetical protein ABI780_01135 [Ardenticatenales bacterium]
MRRVLRSWLVAASCAVALLSAAWAPPRVHGDDGPPVEPRSIDLAVTAPDQTLIAGAPDKEQLGNDLKFGDLNDDGQPDLLLGAHWGSAGGRNIVGRAYVLFGRSSWPATLDLSQQIAGRWSFMGVGREARMGVSLAAGDVSGDHRDDLVIGSLLADPFDQANAGAVYVMFGGASAGGHVDFLNTQPDVIIAGNSTAFDSDRLGTDVVVGDFNGDGRGDIAAAAVLRQNFAGGVFIWFGPFTKGRVINMRTTKPDRTILGGADRSYFGTALVAADVDDDGRTDLFVGAWAPAPIEGPADGGAIHIFRGQTLQNATKDLTPADADLSIVGPAGSTLSGALSLGQCSCHGQPIVFDDITGDGVRDLIMGAPLDDVRKGRVYILPGPLVGRRIDVATAPHLTLTSALPEGKLGWSIATGAIDGDGRTDLVVTLPSANVTVGGASRTEGGIALGIRGPLPITGTLDVNALAALRVLGPDVNSGGTGMTVGLADTDGDGIADLHLGFSNAPALGRRSVGEVHIVRGPLIATLSSPTPTASATEAATATATPSPSATVTPTPLPTLPPTDEPTATPGDSPTADPGGTATPDGTAATATATGTRVPTSAASAGPTRPFGGRVFLPLSLLYRPRRRF